MGFLDGFWILPSLYLLFSFTGIGDAIEETFGIHPFLTVVGIYFLYHVFDGFSSLFSMDTNSSSRKRRKKHTVSETLETSYDSSRHKKKRKMIR